MTKFLFLTLALLLPVEGFRALRSRTAESRAGGRVSAGRLLGAADPYPYFEFAPADGGLGTTPCACAAVLGAKGETITTTRGSSATCLKGDSFISGIVPGDMVTCTSGQPRMVFAEIVNHQLGIWSEKQRTNALLRSEQLENAAWIATAAVTANTTLSPLNALTMDTLTDSSAVVAQGVTQVVATANPNKMALSCFVQGSTADSATIALVGTGNGAGDCTASFTSLSTSTIRRIWCGSTTAYTGAVTAVTASITVGDDVSVQGDLIVWGCQLETTAVARTGDAAGPTSYVATTTVALAREADNPSYALPAPYASPTATVAAGCTKACVRPVYTSNVGATTVPPGYLLFMGANGRAAHSSAGGTVMGWFDGSNDVGYPTVGSNWSASASKCFRSTFTGTTRSLETTGVAAATGAYDGTWGIGVNAVQIGWGTSGGSNDSSADAVVSQIQFDPTDTTKCTTP